MRHLVLTALLLLLSGCHEFSCASKAKPTYLRVHIESNPKTLDPALATGVREFQILQAIFEGLTRYHPETLNPLPGVAERWVLSEDGLRYTFHLRSDAKWSDGRAVTAQDFWDAWEHLLNPQTQSPYAFQLFYLKGAQDYANGILKDPKQIGMIVKGTRVFEVTLERPLPYFLSLTSFSALGPIRKELGPQPYRITNGPFILSNIDPQEGVLLLPNPQYWGHHEIRLNGIQFRPFGDFQTALRLYDRTGIDILTDLPPTQVPLLKFRSDFRNAPLLRTEYFSFQCQTPPFNDVKVRRALSLALNRKEITENILKRGDIPYGLLVPPGLPHYQNSASPQDFDPEKAKALLHESNFDGNPFPKIIIYYNKATDRQLVAKAAQQMWKENLGVESELKEEDWATYLNRRQTKNYQVSWGGWSGDYLDPNTFLELFVSDNRQNHTGWSNPRYDDLIRKGQAEQNLQKRMGYFQEAETILLEEAPIVPVLVKAKTYLIQPYVKGYSANLLDIQVLRDVYSLRP